MYGSPHHTIGYRLSGESWIQVFEGWSPSYELKGPRFWELTISMVECKGLTFIILAKNKKMTKLIRGANNGCDITSPNVRPIEVEYSRPSTKDQNVLRIFLGWDIKKGLKWTVNLTYGPVWINTDTILRAWKLRKGSKLESMTIFQKCIDFAKDNLPRSATAENGKWIWNERWRWKNIM